MPPLAKRALQALIDQALMRGVLIDDDESVLGLGDDEHVVDLGARRAERIGRARAHRPRRALPRVSALGSARGPSGAWARSAKPKARRADRAVAARRGMG